MRFPGCDLIQIKVGVAIDVRAVGQKLAVGRKTLARNLPFVLREPMDLLTGNIEQSDVVVAIARIRGDQDALAIRRNVAG